MGTKANPSPNDCYEKALDDEPMFVLLARDNTAPMLLTQWADMRQHMITVGILPVEEQVKVNDVRVLAKEMATWRFKNYMKWKRNDLQVELATITTPE